jgi:NosR/NirI family transcriptional regulator, nitrous oxide reductase regulator
MFLTRYAKWLHTGWPAGTVEKLPEVEEDGTTALPGVRVVGDLTGVPLLKFSADTGARAVFALLKEEDFQKRKGRDPEVLDLAIVGAGVSGISAAMEAKTAGLRYRVFEAVEELNTIRNFPKQKPIYTYPTEMTPSGQMQLGADVKEALLEELERYRAGLDVVKARVDRLERQGDLLLLHTDSPTTLKALRVIVAIGKSGNYRALGCPGEKLDKVYQRLYDPKDFAGKNVLVVGGGDSAVEAAIALGRAGAAVTLSHRGKELARPKSENLDQLRALEQKGALKLELSSTVKEIREADVTLAGAGGSEAVLSNDVVFTMIGREAPLDFFRRSGIPIRGEWRAGTWVGFVAFFLFCLFVYAWKGGTALNQYFSEHKLFPFGLPDIGGSIFGKTLSITLRQPGFYYSLAYTTAIVLFGWKRIQRRKTPYITRQTLSLMAFQLFPLFLFPYFLLPILGYSGAFDHGFLKTAADHLFPVCGYDYGREYWRAFGLILAWPLFFWNFMTAQPMTWWLVIGCVQTFVIIPLIVYRWGKGAYCGWICSCGALAETVGDTQRQKMPHGPRWNRVNLVGQGILLWISLLFVAKIVLWNWPNTSFGHLANSFYEATFYHHQVWDYYHVVDMFLAGVVGVGLYFWFSGRVWCRFACPLAALMHVYARIGKFRIFADKKKCISCNVCTAVCHQGIDVMSFANKGLPMEDPECVRCSACVQSCPTGTLSFGRVGKNGRAIYDRWAASPVQMAEDGKKHLKVMA